MLRWPITLVLLLSACSKGAEADLQYIGQARSFAAEWALVNEQAARGKLTAAYVKSMHKWLRDNLRATSSYLSQPQSCYGAQIRALLAEPDDASPQELRVHARMLKAIEDSLESA